MRWTLTLLQILQLTISVCAAQDAPSIPDGTYQLKIADQNGSSLETVIISGGELTYPEHARIIQAEGETASWVWTTGASPLPQENGFCNQIVDIINAVATGTPPEHAAEKGFAADAADCAKIAAIPPIISMYQVHLDADGTLRGTIKFMEYKKKQTLRRTVTGHRTGPARAPKRDRYWDLVATPLGDWTGVTMEDFSLVFEDMKIMGPEDIRMMVSGDSWAGEGSPWYTVFYSQDVTTLTCSGRTITISAGGRLLSVGDQHFELGHDRPVIRLTKSGPPVVLKHEPFHAPGLMDGKAYEITVRSGRLRAVDHLWFRRGRLHIDSMDNSVHAPEYTGVIHAEATTVAANHPADSATSGLSVAWNAAIVSTKIEGQVQFMHDATKVFSFDFAGREENSDDP